MKDHNFLGYYEIFVTDKETFYANKRGFVVRLGEANVHLGEGVTGWGEARSGSVLKNRTGQVPLVDKEDH